MRRPSAHGCCALGNFDGLPMRSLRTMRKQDVAGDERACSREKNERDRADCFRNQDEEEHLSDADTTRASMVWRSHPTAWGRTHPCQPRTLMAASRSICCSRQASSEWSDKAAGRGRRLTHRSSSSLNEVLNEPLCPFLNAGLVVVLLALLPLALFDVAEALRSNEIAHWILVASGGVAFLLAPASTVLHLGAASVASGG